MTAELINKINKIQLHVDIIFAEPSGLGLLSVKPQKYPIKGKIIKNNFAKNKFIFPAYKCPIVGRKNSRIKGPKRDIFLYSQKILSFFGCKLCFKE